MGTRKGYTEWFAGSPDTSDARSSLSLLPLVGCCLLHFYHIVSSLPHTGGHKLALPSLGYSRPTSNTFSHLSPSSWMAGPGHWGLVFVSQHTEADEGTDPHHELRGCPRLALLVRLVLCGVSRASLHPSQLAPECLQSSSHRTHLSLPFLTAVGSYTLGTHQVNGHC